LNEKNVICCKCGKAGGKFLKLKCGHIYHAECLVDYFVETKQTNEQYCKICNKLIDWNDVYQINN